MSWKTIILIFFFILLINYGLHQAIINQDKEIRESCLKYVEERCSCNQEKTTEYKLNQSLNYSWNIQK